jgi:hypothetical protein
MSIFVRKSDEYNVNFFVGTLAGKTVFYRTETEAEEALGKGGFDSHSLTCRPLSYAASMKVQETSLRNDDGRLVFDPIKFRSSRFRQSVIGWSFKDEEGKNIPVNDDTIGSLSEDAAIFLMNLLNDR